MKHRKCDTAKYRRRRQKEKISGSVSMQRRERQEREYRHRCQEADQARYRLIAQKRVHYDRIVDILAGRLYSLSPYHVAEARLMQLTRIANVMGRASGLDRMAGGTVMSFENVLRLCSGGRV